MNIEFLAIASRVWTILYRFQVTPSGLC